MMPSMAAVTMAIEPPSHLAVSAVCMPKIALMGVGSVCFPEFAMFFLRAFLVPVPFAVRHGMAYSMVYGMVYDMAPPKHIFSTPKNNHEWP